MSPRINGSGLRLAAVDENISKPYCTFEPVNPVVSALSIYIYYYYNKTFDTSSSKSEISGVHAFYRYTGEPVMSHNVQRRHPRPQARLSSRIIF